MRRSFPETEVFKTGSLFDYVKWRGDLSFNEAPLNEVDALIFSLLVYVDLKDIVPEEWGGTAVPIQAAANAFFARHPNIKKYSMGLIVPKDIIKLLRVVKDTRRFRGVEMRGFVNRIDMQEEMQFAAVTFFPGDGTQLVTFRGTDDSLVGWKENFNMSFRAVVPAQREALAYLSATAVANPQKIRVAGHSKGGNLAVYAAVCADETVKKRIQTVWSQDGPGFQKGFIETKAYLESRHLIKTIVPQSSVIGMLLEHDENYTVVKSKQTGLFQHDGLSWEVLGGSFVHLQEISHGSKRLDHTLNEWIHAMTPEQREEFVDALYQILSTDNSTTLSEFFSLKKGRIKKLAEIDPEVRKSVQKTLAVLLELNTKNLLSDILPKK